MEITIKGTMPNGAKIQIEDWSKDLPHLLNTKYIIGAYPISKRSLQGQFAAKEGKPSGQLLILAIKKMRKKHTINL